MLLLLLLLRLTPLLLPPTQVIQSFAPEAVINAYHANIKETRFDLDYIK